MKIKLTGIFVFLFLTALFITFSESEQHESIERATSYSLQSKQEALSEMLPDRGNAILRNGIQPLEIEGIALTPVVSIPSPTYTTESPELQGQLTATEDTGPKFRKSGFRNEAIDPDVVQEYFENGEAQAAKFGGLNRSLVSSFDAGGQAVNAANANSLFIPADPHGAAGPNHLVNVFNVSIETYNKNGTGGASTSLQNFFAPLNPVNFTFDPKVLYDQHADRWVVVTVQRTDTANGDPANTSNVFVAVSETSDPTGAWFMTSINTVVNISGADRWFDYPGLAVDEEVIYLTGNMFSFGVGAGAGSRLWIIDKADFYAGNAPVVLGPIDPYAGGGVNTTTQPAHVYGAAPASFGTYLVSYSRLANASGIEFWQSVRVDNPLGAISFNQQFIAIGDIEPNGAALPVAPQAGLSTDTNASLTVATNDPRALDAVWRNNMLYGTATIESQTELGETSASWVSFDADGAAAISLDQFGVVDGENIAPGTFTFFPSIAVNLDGGIALGYSASAPTINPGSYYTFKSTTDTDMRDSRVLRAGTDFYFRSFQAGNNRWGDYSAMVVDPNDECFWVYNKHAVTRGLASNGNDEDGMYLTAFGEVCNDEPVGNNDAAAVNQNGTVTTVNGASTSVLANDTDADVDDTLIAVLLTSPADASAFNLNANGTFSYTHNGDTDNTDSFTYNACDDGTPAKCDAATVNITINITNSNPVAMNDSATTDEDSSLSSIDLTNNDTDGDGDDIEIQSIDTTGTVGQVSVNGDNDTVSYDPNDQFESLAVGDSVQDTFGYTAEDGNGGTDSATVTVTVNGVNDAPEAANDTANTDEDVMVPVSVLAGDSDVDTGDTLSVTSCSNASNGSVVQNGNTCEFTPAQDFNGQGGFDYAISDGNGGTDSAAVTVTVDAVNDQPNMVINQAVYINLSDTANPPAQNLACQFDFGPADEDGSQAVADMNVSIVNDANNVLSAIDVDNSGALSYTFSGNSGVAEVTVSMQDDGGTSNGGDDTSTDYTFFVNVQDYVFRSDFEADVCQ